MKLKRKRILPVLTALCVLLGALAMPAGAANPGGVEYVNTHVNTGNQREDILAVAFTQLGYTELEENDTRYGDWLGYPYQPWCASFVSWCARQADISTDILKSSPRANPREYGIKSYHGSEYTPQPGDLFFSEKYTHVGLVWYVEGDFFYCIEGNAKYHDYQVADDPTVDSFHVRLNKRLISTHRFGVPEYLGTDGDHSYVKGTDSAHPHKTYYRCSDCGDKYYTGYTAIQAGCSQCLTCGCSSDGAGYYLMSISSGSDPIRLRAGHSTSVKAAGYVSSGAVVYVHGTCSDGWACIEYDGRVGHMQTKYLKKYKDLPASPVLSCDDTAYVAGDSATITWDAAANAEQYRVKVYRDGVLYRERYLDKTRSITMKDLPRGEYEVQVTACNRAGASAPGTLKFSVIETYTLTYSAQGSSVIPEPQTQEVGKAVTITDLVPIREGYEFLGWTEYGSHAAYQAGDSFIAYEDVTLYAVWKSDDASLAEVAIAQMPARTMYLEGEALDPAGLALTLTYSDGSGHVVTDGYTMEGFDSDSCGTKTVTVTYGSMTADFEVQVVSYLPGDMDMDQTVDRDDVIRLMEHIDDPAAHPLTVPADLNGDGAVDQTDVTQLMWHISFPDKFPLAAEWTVEPPAEPEQPTEPELPTEPEVPTEPEEPTEPELPETPTVPQEVTEPETAPKPEEPTEPAPPAESEVPTEPEAGGGEGD